MIIPAVLLLCSPAIDYETVAKPLPIVLEELSKQTGVQMRASKAIEEDRLVIRVRGVDIVRLRDKIAEAVAGNWSEKDGVFTLQRDERLKKRRYDDEVDRRARWLRMETDKFFASLMDYRKQDIEVVTKRHYGTMVNYFFAGAVLKKFDFRELAALPIGSRRVYSTHPTPMQESLPDLSEITAEAVREHNRIAEVAAKVEVDEPPVGSPQAKARQALLRKWVGPLRVVAIARTMGAPQVMVLLVDRDGTVVGTGSALVGQINSKPGPKLPNEVSPNAPIELSRIGRYMASLLSGFGQFGPQNELTAEERERLGKPTLHDPLSFHFSELLLGIATAANWQLVAHAADEMVKITDANTFTIRSAIDTVFRESDTWHSLADNWLTVGPTNIGGTRQVDRKALERIIDISQRKEPSIEDYAEYATHAPPPWTVYLTLAYESLGPQFSYGDAGWLWLQVYDSLTEAQKKAVRAGTQIAVSQLSPATRKMLSTIAFETTDAAYLSDDNSPFLIDSNMQLDIEPTEIMPTGLPGSLMLRLVASSRMAVETSLGGRRARYPISTLAHFAAADPKSFGDEGPPAIGEFKIGSFFSISMSMRIREGMRLEGTLREFIIDRQSKSYTIMSAPEDFQKAYREALAKYRGGERSERSQESFPK